MMADRGPDPDCYECEGYGACPDCEGAGCSTCDDTGWCQTCSPNEEWDEY